MTSVNLIFFVLGCLAFKLDPSLLWELARTCVTLYVFVFFCIALAYVNCETIYLHEPSESII